MKPFTRRRFAVLAAATGLAWLAAPALAASDVLRVGVSSTPQVESLQIAVKEAKAQGLNVELVEFSDWNTPNAALANGDIDVNYFQHIPFLENAKKQGGYDFVSVGTGTIMKIGLYSHKWKSFADIPAGGKVAIASDPVNGGRGLLLLERAGLIKLKPGLGYKATTLDIVANPKKLNIIALEASQLARALDDVDLAQGYPSFLRLAGENPDNALLFDGVENKIFALQWVVRKQDAANPKVQQFIRLYQNSKQVRASLDKVFGKLYAPAWL